MKLAKKLMVLSAMIIGVHAYAADYPSHTITWVVPYSAGGGVDATARIVSKYVSKELKEPIVIENRPGAGGSIGATYVVHSKPDGYTFLVTGNGPLAVAPKMIKGFNHYKVSDFRIVSLLITSPQLLVVSGESKIKNLAEYIAASKKTPITIGGTLQSGQEVAAKVIGKETGAAQKFVPYKGTSNVVNGILNHTVVAGIVDPSATSLIKAGKLHAIGATTAERSKANPDIPTLLEQGAKGVVITSFYGLVGPAKLPDEIVKKMNLALKKALSDPEIVALLKKQGLDARYTTPQEAEAYLRESIKNVDLSLGLAK